MIIAYVCVSVMTGKWSLVVITTTEGKTETENGGTGTGTEIGTGTETETVVIGEGIERETAPGRETEIEREIGNGGEAP